MVTITRYAHDVLIADLRLPEMSGELLAAKVQSLFPHTQVIFTSAAGECPQGTAAVVRKPIEFATLVEALEQALRISNRAR